MHARVQERRRHPLYKMGNRGAVSRLCDYPDKFRGQVEAEVAEIGASSCCWETLQSAALTVTLVLAALPPLHLPILTGGLSLTAKSFALHRSKSRAAWAKKQRSGSQRHGGGVVVVVVEYLGGEEEEGELEGG